MWSRIFLICVLSVTKAIRRICPPHIGIALPVELPRTGELMPGLEVLGNGLVQHQRTPSSQTAKARTVASSGSLSSGLR
jgi:hypothetical protein